MKPGQETKDVNQKTGNTRDRRKHRVPSQALGPPGWDSGEAPEDGGITEANNVGETWTETHTLPLRIFYRHYLCLFIFLSPQVE